MDLSIKSNVELQSSKKYNHSTLKEKVDLPESTFFIYALIAHLSFADLARLLELCSSMEGLIGPSETSR